MTNIFYIDDFKKKKDEKKTKNKSESSISRMLENITKKEENITVTVKAKTFMEVDQEVLEELRKTQNELLVAIKQLDKDINSLSDVKDRELCWTLLKELHASLKINKKNIEKIKKRIENGGNGGFF